MADVTITVTIADVFKLVAQRTSVATETDPFYANMTTEQRQYSQLHGESDRLTLNLLKEAAKEVLRCFVSRQGDVAGVPYEVTATTVVYRFAEATPLLTQAPAIKIRLTENTRDAIVYFIMAALYKTDGNTNKLALMNAKCVELINELTGDLYRLHD
jgi:hypothetical protein